MNAISEVSSNQAAEIDLIKLFEVFWKRRFEFILCVAVVLLIGLVFIFLTKPRYQVSSVVRPVGQSVLDTLNRSMIYSLSPAGALDLVGDAMVSYDTLSSFFRDHGELLEIYMAPGRTLEQNFEHSFKDNIKVVRSDPKKTREGPFVELTYEYLGGEPGPEILNKLMSYIIEKATREVIDDVSSIINNRLIEVEGKLSVARVAYEDAKSTEVATLLEGDKIKRQQLEDEVEAIREQLAMQRSNRIEALNEAIIVARALNIDKPSTPAQLSVKSQGRSGGGVYTEVNNQVIPLYFMGVDALEAERSVLLSRKSDDFTSSRIAEIAKEQNKLLFNRRVEALQSREQEELFLVGIESQRAEALRLRGLNGLTSNLKLVTVDRHAVEPVQSVSPRRGLVMALSLALGVVLGTLVICIREFICINRTEKLIQATVMATS